MNLQGRNLLTLSDYTKEEIEYLLELSARLKDEKKRGIFEKKLINKNIALIFEKPSTRTRCAFTVAASDLGAHSEYLGVNDIQLGHKESTEDTARVLGRMFDGIAFRGFSQVMCEKLTLGGVPVWNALTDDDHPTQILADLLTMKEHFGKLSGLKFLYIGDGRNNMANALMIGAWKMGIEFTICTPESLTPDKALIDLCAGAKISVVHNPADCKGYDVVYTDVWYSMGEEAKKAERETLLRPYQVNEKLMAQMSDNAIFLHCLPAVKGNEVTEEVFEKHAEIIFDQAENRMHTIKAVMYATVC